MLENTSVLVTASVQNASAIATGNIGPDSGRPAILVSQARAATMHAAFTAMNSGRARLMSEINPNGDSNRVAPGLYK